MFVSHEHHSVLENLGVRFHTSRLSATLGAAGLPENGVGRGGSRELEKRQNSVYNNWTWHQEKDSAVAELVRDYAQVKARFDEPANIFEIQEELTTIKEKLERQLDYQLSSNNNLPEAVRAEAMGEPLKTIEELIGE